MKYKVGTFLKQENLNDTDKYRILKVIEISDNGIRVEIIYDFIKPFLKTSYLDIFMDRRNWKIRKINKDEAMVELL